MPEEPATLRIQATVLQASQGQALVQIVILANDEVVYLSEPQVLKEGDTAEVILNLAV